MDDNIERQTGNNQPPTETIPVRQAKWRAAGIIAILYTVLYAVWTLFHWGGEESAVYIADFSNAPIGFLAAFAAWRVVADRQLDRGVRRAWLILGLAVFSSSLGEAFWFLYDAVLKVQPFPSLADAFYLPFYPLVFLGLLAIPNAPVSREARAKFWLDLAIVMAVAGMFVWYFIVAPTLTETEGDLLSQALAAAYPIGDLMAMAGVVVLVFRRINATTRRALLIFSCGLIFTLGSDLYFAYASLFGDYAPGSFMEAGFVAGHALYLLAAVEQFTSGGGLNLSQGRWSKAISAAVPFVAVTLGYGLVVFAYSAGGSYFWDLFVISALLALLVIARQVVALREIESLTGRLNAASDELRSLSQDLERRVISRTRDLQAAAEVGQHISRVRDVDVLLTEAVELIRAHFDLYYVQVCLLDSSSQMLLMRAGTGPVGNELRLRGFRLPVGSDSLNGLAVLEKRPVVVADTKISPNFRPNTLLPDTRSEMCVPLSAGDQVIGVLDLQSAQPEGLTADNLPAFVALAGQLAIALENAELFQQAAVARAEMEAQARRLTEAGWQDFLNGIERREQIGFTYSAGRIKPLVDGPMASEQKLAEENVLNVPITVADVPVGQISLAGESWTEADNELVRSVAMQVSQQIENLRLLAQAEGYRLEAERAARRLTRQVWQEHAETMTAEGYAYDLNQVSPLTTTAEAASETVPVLKQPLTLHDEVIGELELVGVSGPTDEAAELAALVAGQLTAHIENLRLARQTQAALSETEEQARRLTILNELGEALNQAGNFDGVLKITASKMTRIFATNRVSAALLTPSQDGLEVLDLDEEKGLMPTGMKLPLEGTAVGSAVKTGRSVVTLDTTTSPYLDSQALSQQGALSTITAPLVAGEAVVGALNVSAPEKNAFGASDEKLMFQITSLVGATIARQRLFEQTQLRAKELAILNDVGQKLISESDLMKLITVVGDTICNNLGADQGYIGLYDSAADRLEFPYYSMDGQVVAAQATSLGTGVNALVIQKHQPLLINREIDRRMMNIGAKTMDFSRRPKVWLGVPILAGHDRDPIGLVSIQSRTREDAFDEDTVRLLTTIAASLSTAIQNMRLFAEARKRADREALVNTIGQKIQDTTSVQGAMQVAIEELGRAFKARRTVVQLTTAKPENGNGDPGAHA